MGKNKMTFPHIKHHPAQQASAAVPAATTQQHAHTQEDPFPSRHLDLPSLYEAKVTAENATQMLDNLVLLNQDDRLMAAEDLRKKLTAFVGEGAPSSLKDALRARMETSPLREDLALLQNRGVECREAAEDLAGYENWTLAVRSFGFDTYVRPMGGQMYVKVEGEQEGTSVFDQLVVVRQAAMYHRWGPFICSSELVHSFKELDMIVSFELNAPFFHRDCVMRGYACDYSEKDMILICGDSTSPEEYPSHGLPAEPTGWLFKRMFITRFRCQVQLHGVNKGKVILAALIDPQTALPQSVVNFCLKQIVGVLLYLILRTARRLDEGGDKLGEEYLEVIRQDPYYRTLCLPRILWYCEKNKWEYPVPGTNGGDAVLVSAAAAVQQVVQEDIGGLLTDARGGATTQQVQEGQEGDVMDSKKRKHFLRRLFRRKKHHHKHHHASHEDLAVPQVAAMTPVLGVPGGGLCPLHDHQAQEMATVSAIPAIPATSGLEGNVLSWTLPAVALTYLLTRMTIAPVVRSFSGPVGEAIVLAFLLQQVLSLLLQKNLIDPSSCLPPFLGGVDLSHAVFAASLGMSLLSLLATTLQTHTLMLREDVHPLAWHHLSVSNVHLINTGLFLLVLLLIFCQPKTRQQLRKLASFFSLSKS